jgi:hypothetical protein
MNLPKTRITRCELLHGEVHVTFDDGYTFAFTDEFLHASRLKHGQLLSANIPAAGDDPTTT